MTLWSPNPHTGRFPPFRILWNLLWILPVQITRGIFCACCLLAYGPRDARKAWRDTE
jgi:hypothetical protein